MNTFTKIAAVMAVAVLATSGFAQRGGGGGQGGGQGRGGFGGGQGRGGFGGGMMGGAGNRFMLLQRVDVQNDLGLSSEQKTKLEGIQTAMQEEMREVFQQMRDAGGGGGFDREAMTAAMTKVTEGMQKKVEAVLTPTQTKRLKEIGVQLDGNRAILTPEIQKDLGITDAQKAKIKALQDKQAEANQAVMEKMRNGELDRDQFTEIRTKNDKVMGEELGKLLTPEQAAKLKAMAGKPFKADGGG